MGIKTEDFFPKLPPKEMTAGIDWLGLLDSFDPTTLEEKYINECARRNPCYTSYQWDNPEPIEKRLHSIESVLKLYRPDLEKWSKRIETDGLTPSAYKNARAKLIKLIGIKGAQEYNRREDRRQTEEEKKKQKEAYENYEAYISELVEEEKKKRETEPAFWVPEPASVHEKVILVRKGVLASNKKPLTQRQFAKYIGYPVTKYAEAEKTDFWTRAEDESPVEDALLEKLIMICHANPFWLYDDDPVTTSAEYSPDNEIVQAGDAPCVFATPDIILKWIEMGKPTSTNWWDGVVLKDREKHF